MQELARRIRLAGLQLTVVTNGLVVARELSEQSNVSLIVLGGKLRPANMSTTVRSAMAMLETLWFDHPFSGTSAISDEGWISSFDADEAQLNAHVAKRATSVSVIADHSKFSTRAAHSVLRVNASHGLVSDRAPSGPPHSYLTDAGVKMRVAEHG